MGPEQHTVFDADRQMAADGIVRERHRLNRDMLQLPLQERRKRWPQYLEQLMELSTLGR